MQPPSRPGSHLYVYGQVAEPFGRIGAAPSKRQVAVSENGGLTWSVFEPR